MGELNQQSEHTLQRQARQAQREAKWLARWQTRGWATRVLWPASWLFQKIAAVRKWAFTHGWRAQYRMPVPVVVVGGIMIGGVGKTPIVAQLVRQLQQAGFQPGIITRGYGSQADRERREIEVTAYSSAQQVGDEPLLLHRATGVPIWVGANRVNAARALCAAHPECDVIVCDDGLQHYRLYRDLEIAVVDGRGVGNGWCLPAGPLRESPARLNTVSALVYHQRRSALERDGQDGSEPDAHCQTLSDLPWMPRPLTTPQFGVCSGLNRAYALTEVQRTIALNDLVQQYGVHKNKKVLMLAGIAQPQVFFDMLADLGFEGESLALPDHAPFDAALAERLIQLQHEKACAVVLMTEKDAVKCLPWIEAFPALAESIWVLPLSVRQDEGWQGFAQHIISRLKGLAQNFGSQEASDV